MYRHRQFSGDPHPGNCLLLGDGRVAFLDFGLFNMMPRNLIELEPETQRAGHEGDAHRLWEIWAEGRLLRQPERFRPDKLLSQFLDATWWYLTDEEIELGPEIATQVMIDMADPRSTHFGQMRHETLPADTSSAAGWRRSRSPCSASSARGPTGTGSRASGCMATRP